MSNPYGAPQGGQPVPPYGQQQAYAHPHPQAPAPEKKKKPFYKRWWFIVLAVFVVLAAAMNGAGGSGDGDTRASDRTAAVAQEAGATEVANDESGDVPVEYRNALRKAETYSKYMHMSRQGIYDQLVSEYGENFSPEAAQYAIDTIEADWNANALEKAKSYQDTMAMSRDAIYDQLVSEYGEQFTPEEAQYAVDNLPQ